MAMLAEPRRKLKWTLNPRGKFWSEDKNKFGQRMLEKMGWSEGKGLGANEQGSTSHVAVKVKNDNKGLGSSIKDGEWCRHQEQFENLLANLNDSTDTKTNASSLTSLEEISKNSKKRLHYAKFTRGKDLSLYSKKDLDCILGVGVRKEEKPVIDDLKDVGTVDTLYGVTTIVGGSVDDYFKKKMTSLSQACIVDNGHETGNEKPIRKRKADFQDEELIELSNDNQIIDGESGDAGNNCKRKKKRKFKNQNGDVEAEDVDQSTKGNNTENMMGNMSPLYLDEDLEVVSTSKEKTRFKENIFEKDVEEEIEVLEDSNWKICEKKKKKRITIDDIQESDTMVVKEKQRKKGSRCVDGIKFQNVINGDSQSVGSLKKRSLNNSECVENSVEDEAFGDDAPEICEIVAKKVVKDFSDNALGSEVQVKKKSRKKRKDVYSEEVVCLGEILPFQEDNTNSEEVVCLGELLSFQEDNTNETAVYNAATGIKSKKRKAKGPRNKNLESSDEILEIVDVSEDSERWKSDLGNELESEFAVNENKGKLKKKNGLSNNSEVDEKFFDTPQSIPKKSKKSKGNKPLMYETISCDEMNSNNGVEILQERVNKIAEKDISDASGTVLTSNCTLIDNKVSLTTQESDKESGVILTDAVKQDGKNIEAIGYYNCLKKKEKNVLVSEVLHVFNGANLKDIKGYAGK